MIDKRDASAFEDIKVHVRFKLFALWSSVMFFYIYGDYFELFQPGKLQDMLSGRTPLGAMSQGVLLGMSAIMVIPSLMPFLSLVLPAGVNRWVSLYFGAALLASLSLDSLSRCIMQPWRPRLSGTWPADVNRFGTRETNF